MPFWWLDDLAISYSIMVNITLLDIIQGPLINDAALHKVSSLFHIPIYYYTLHQDSCWPLPIALQVDSFVQDAISKVCCFLHGIIAATIIFSWNINPVVFKSSRNYWASRWINQIWGNAYISVTWLLKSDNILHLKLIILQLKEKETHNTRDKYVYIWKKVQW